MTVTTTARAPLAAAERPFGPRGPGFPELFQGSFPAWLAVLALVALLAGVSFAGFKRKPLRRLVPVAGLILLIVTAGYLAGCAGGFPSETSSGSETSTGTPAGTYTIRVTGTSGTDVHSTTVTLIVQ